MTHASHTAALEPAGTTPGAWTNAFTAPNVRVHSGENLTFHGCLSSFPQTTCGDVIMYSVLEKSLISL